MQDHKGVYYQLVEKVIKAIGLDPIKTRKKEGEWVVFKNQIPIWIYLYYNKISKGYFYQVSAPVIHMPKENRGAFCEQLLSLNSTLFGAAFMEKRGTVYIHTVREVEGLDVKEAYTILERIGNYMHYYQESQKTGLLNWTPYNSAGPNAARSDSDS